MRDAKQLSSCPKCSATNVRTPFSWLAFGVSFLAIFFVGGGIQTLKGKVPWNFFLEMLCNTASMCVVVSFIWIFFSALLGKNRCKACGHRWKGKFVPKHDAAWATLETAIKLETQGDVSGAIAKYEEVIAQYGHSEASREAQQCIESLRKKISA